MPFHSYVIWSCSLFVLIILCCDSFHRLNAESLNAESPIPNWTECRNNKCRIPQLPICTECQIFECRMELEISNAELDWRPIVTEYFHLRTDWHWNTGWCWRWGGRCDPNIGIIIDDRTDRGGATRRGPRLLSNRKMFLQKQLQINTRMENNLNPGTGLNIPDPQHWSLLSCRVADPDPYVMGLPDPHPVSSVIITDPSIIKQKKLRNVDFYYFVNNFLTFILEECCKCTSIPDPHSNL